VSAIIDVDPHTSASRRTTPWSMYVLMLSPDIDEVIVAFRSSSPSTEYAYVPDLLVKLAPLPLASMYLARTNRGVNAPIDADSRSLIHSVVTTKLKNSINRYVNRIPVPSIALLA
jgi:hypothetical protein